MTELRLAERYINDSADTPWVDLLHTDAATAIAWTSTRFGRLDLVYMDPPYATGKAFEFVVGPKENPRPRPGFDDLVSDVRSLVDGLGPVFDALRTGLSSNGGVLLHCDPRSAPYFSIALDGALGLGERQRAVNNAAGFRNELVWAYGLGGSSPRSWPRKHDSILWYTAGREWFFVPPRVPATSARLRGQTKKHPDVLNIPSINNMAIERTGYPTQKPIELLRILVEAHASEDAIVLDPFAGSGTTGEAAAALGRACVLADISADSIAVCRSRLLDAGASLRVWRPSDGSTPLLTDMPIADRAYFAAGGSIDSQGVFEASEWMTANFRSAGLNLAEALPELGPCQTLRLWTDGSGDLTFKP
jgi:hypothetical protein